LFKTIYVEFVLLRTCQRRHPIKDPIISPMGIGAGLEEYRAPMEHPNKIPNGDWGGFEAHFGNWIWGWGWPPHSKLAPLPFLLISDNTYSHSLSRP
jgi:hypothetical protein